jgi:hypothetical protein
MPTETSMIPDIEEYERSLPVLEAI